MLRATIAQLRAELAKRPTEEVVREVEKRVEVPVLSETDRTLIESARDLSSSYAASLESLLARFPEEAVPQPAVKRPPAQIASARRPAIVTPVSVQSDVQSAGPISPLSDTEVVKLGKAERAILAGLATHGGMPHKRLALIAGYSATSSGFKNPLATLRRVGYAVGGGDHIQITDAGREALGDFEPLPSGQALIDYWMASPQFGKAERTILSALIDAWPTPLTHNELAERAEYEPTSSGFKNPLAKLRRLEVVHGDGRAIVADEELGKAAHDA